MFLIRVPDDTVNRLMSVADSQRRSFSEYLTEILKQDVRAHELGCSLKETVDLYKRTMTGKEAAEEAERVEEPSIDKVFERILASKLRPKLSDSKERRMLSSFLSEISKKPS